MKISRRHFIGAAVALGLGGCAKLKPKLAPATDALARLKPNLDMLSFGDKGPFSFATLADFHLLDARSTAIPSRAVRQILEDDRITFTIALGDLASAGEIQELNLAKHVLAPFEERFHAIPGEHDMNPSIEKRHANYRSALGDTRWSYERHGWRIIGLDTTDGVTGQPSLRQDQFEWLEKELARSSKKQPMALFTHHPLLAAPERFRLTNAPDVLALFQEHSLKLVASGHYHGNQEVLVDDVLHTTTACCSSTVDNDDGTDAKGFRLFHVDDADVLTTEFVPL